MMIAELAIAQRQPSGPPKAWMAMAGRLMAAAAEPKLPQPA